MRCLPILPYETLRDEMKKKVRVWKWGWGWDGWRRCQKNLHVKLRDGVWWWGALDEGGKGRRNKKRRDEGRVGVSKWRVGNEGEDLFGKVPG